MIRVKSRHICLFVIPLLILTSFFSVRYVYAAEQTVASENHYLGFASDLHDTSGTLEGAFGEFPNDPEYVSLVGDMVGAKGGDAPAFNSSDILSRIQAIDTCKNIDSSNASIVWADHDSGVNDDAGIVKGMGNPAGYMSGQIYEGKNSDGSTAYYIYVVGFYHMLDGGDTSKAAAKAFKSWVTDKDVTVPVIVLCHAPLVAKRGDNLGATYWSEALNYAATGLDGIISEDDTGKALIRNVIFLSGHNHTVDANEYVYSVGSVMSVQVDADSEGNGLIGASHSIEATESYDEDLDDNVKASGTNTRVYYTALTPGYLKTSGNGTLITIADKSITFDKYNGSGRTALGVTAEGNTVASPLNIDRIEWGDPVYTWSDDLSTVTATRSLKSNPDYKESETVPTTKTVSKQPTSSEKGEHTYTANFSNPAFETQTKTIADIDIIAAADDDEPSYSESKTAPPNTADGSDILLWIFMLMPAAAGLSFIGIKRIKHI